MSDATTADSTAAAEKSKGPPPLDPRLTPAQTLQKSPEPLVHAANEARSKQPLLASRFGIAEYRNMRKWCCVPEGVKIERVLETDFWAVNANALTICDVVEVHADDRSFYAEVYVRDKGRNWAKVSLLKLVEFDKITDQPAPAAEYTVAFKGPVNKWCVVRLADGELIKEKCETREAANTELAQFVRGLGR